MEKLARCDLLDDYEEDMRQTEKYDAFLIAVNKFLDETKSKALSLKTCRNEYNGHIALMAHYLMKIEMYGAVAMGGDGLF